MSFFEANHICKKYGDFVALNDVSISVPQKSIYGLLGPNGAGKTTLIRIINQITGPDKGELFFNGHPLKPEDVAQIGYLPEERGLYKQMKVGEQALYLAQLKGLSKSEAISRLKYWFKKMEIAEWWDKKIEELSKGMQQKVQFITTVLHSPKLLIFDEPFSGFDPVNANIIKNEILNLRDEGTTVILSTHNMSSVEELCDDITLINKSRSILQGKVSDIRKEWAGDEYDIEIKNMIPQDYANQPYRIISCSEDNGKTTIKIKAEANVSRNVIIQSFLNKGEILSFNPSLPSMNDIFIRVVGQSNGLTE